MRNGLITIMDDRSHLVTEHRNPRSHHLDTLTTQAAFDLINSEDVKVAAAVAAAKKDICRAVDMIVAAFQANGRLIYVGAGTSGRLGVMDAAECPPTFLTDPEMVQGIIAGSDAALTRSVEGAEDHSDDGGNAIREMNVGPRDVVFAITTGGTTPFVHGAVREARKQSAKTVFLACVPAAQVPDEADVSIRVITGPEVVTGSTRMKAGTATKMVLNMVTTISMVRLGKVYGNLMVDVDAGVNRKLIDRAVRIVRCVTNLSNDAARELLQASKWHVKPALVMHAHGVGLDAAQALLREARGQVSGLLGKTTHPESHAGVPVVGCADGHHA
ncbi:MAG: N-acetylmuramic acid 6-phosphate etherase [Planctomycetes bacterium]|nr:N-acetylmuramic acid 6-phosphate etherase [Planctomycetota bacterium]